MQEISRTAEDFRITVYILQRSITIQEVCYINRFIDSQFLGKILFHRYEETRKTIHLTAAVSSEEKSVML